MSESVCPFVWHDLMTTDTAAAKAFYAQVFGWSMQAFPGSGDYTVVSAGSTGVGGIMPIPAEARARGAPLAMRVFFQMFQISCSFVKCCCAAGHFPENGSFPKIHFT